MFSEYCEKCSKLTKSEQEIKPVIEIIKMSVNKIILDN